MKNIKRILVLLIMVLVSVTGLTACGDPYENMTLTIDKGGFENALGRRYEYNPSGNTFDITAIIDGVEDEEVSTDVVFTLEDTSVINMSTAPVKVDNKTTQTFNVLNTGEAIINVKSVEGGLSEKINISIFANPESISFIEETIPVIKGQSIDFTKISTGYSKAPISFEPSYATEKGVSYAVYEDAEGYKPIYPGGQYEIDGNIITFSESASADKVYIRAFGENSTETDITEVVLLEPIDLSKLGLSYTYSREDQSTNSRTFFDIDKSRESGIDYEVFLADQYSGDDDRDAKNIYLTTKSGKTTTIVNDYSLTMTNVNAIENSYIYSNATGAGNVKKPCYSICNGSGEGNFDIVKFNINYKGYESFFVGYDITLKITVDAFPNDVIISHDADLEALDEKESIMIYNVYANQLGTPFYVKIVNKGGEYIQNQYAYVNVYNTTTKEKANPSYFNIYDANGNVVSEYTKVKSGSLLYIKYVAIGNQRPSDIKSVKEDGSEDYNKFVLYACSAIDSSITSLTKEESVTDEIYEYNNLKLAKLNYSVAFTNDDGEITIMTNDADLDSAEAEFVHCHEQSSGLGTTIVNPDYPTIDEFVITTSNPELVSINFDGTRYTITAVDENKLGTATITIVAPNGSQATMDVHITKSPSASTFELLVGNNLLKNGDVITFNVNVNSKMAVVILVDGIEYSTMPHGYSFTYEATAAVSGFSDSNMALSTGNKKSEGDSDKYKFYIKYAGAEISSAEFYVNIYVIKPVNSVSRSEAQVEMLFNDINVINNSDVDKNVETPDDPSTKAYTDISDYSSKTVKFTFNPKDSTIQQDKLGVEFKYNGQWTSITNFVEKGTITISTPDSVTYKVYGADVDYETGILLEDEDEVYVRFAIEYYIANDEVYVTIYNISTNAPGNLNLSLKLGYVQEYKLSVQKTYYIEEVKNAGGEVIDRYYYTDTNKPTTSRVQYIGGQKMSSSDVSADGKHININGLLIPIVNKEITIPGSTGATVSYKAFTYDTYKVEISSQTDYIVRKPVKNESISFVGVNYETRDVRYYVSGDYSYDSAAPVSASNGEHLRGFYLSTKKDGSEKVEEVTPFDGKLDYRFNFDGENPISVTIDGSKTYSFAQMESSYNSKFFIVIPDGENFVLNHNGKNYTTIFGESYTLEKSSSCGSCDNCLINGQPELCLDPVLTLTHSGGAYEVVDRSECGTCIYCIDSDPLTECNNRNHAVTSNTVQVRIGDTIEFRGYEGIKYFDFEERLSYQSKTINKNQIDDINKQVYYLGNDGTNNYLYTNILQPITSRINYIGGYSITDSNFIAPSGSVVTQIKLNIFTFDVKEMEYNSVIYRYIEIPAIKLYYKTSPAEVQLRGLLFEDASGIISKFNYVDDKVVGAATRENISNAYGISVSIDYSVDYIQFLILDKTIFEAKMTSLGYEWMLTFVTADSYNTLTSGFNVSRPFGLKLATGTEDNPYVIDDAKSFMAIAKDNTAYYRVDRNISLFSVKDFVPFESFKGHITTKDDQQYSISEFNINLTYDLGQSYYGMFRHFEGSIANITFKNFKVSLNVKEDFTISESKQVFFGSFAGEFKGTMTNCEFIDDESTNYDNYAVANISNTSPYGVSLINNNKVKYVGAEPLAISYNVGGVFGTTQNTGSSTLTNIQSSVKIYVLTSNENQNVTTGGFAGINGQDITTAKIYSVIYVNSSQDNSETITGGVVGINKAGISDIKVTTYISAINNVGGVVGQTSEHSTTINTATVNPYIRANDNVGGVIGISSAEVHITSTKVQFADKVLGANQLSKTNSAIIANNYIGGLVGNSTADVYISYSSVVSYMTQELGLLTTFAEVDTSRNKYIGDIISTYSAARIGGFVGNTSNVATINNSYYDANVVSYGNLADDLGNIYFGGIIGYSGASRWGSISSTSVEGEFYYLSDDFNANTVVVGGFAGNLDDDSLAFSYDGSYITTSYTNGSDIVSTVNKNHYTIFNSYTALKYAKINTAGPTTSNYVDNFVGANKKITENYTLVVVEATIDGTNLTIKYTTPTNATEQILTYPYTGEDVSIDLNGDGEINVAEDLKLNKTSLPSDKRYVNYEVESYKINVLTYNSFYIGFETFVNFVELTTIDDEEVVKLVSNKPIDNLKKITFTEADSTRTNLLIDGITYDYYSGRATNGTTSYAVIYDNLKQKEVFAKSNISITANVAGLADNTLYSAVAGQLINDSSSVNDDVNNEHFITSRAGAFAYADIDDGSGTIVRTYFDKYADKLYFDGDKYVSYSVNSGTKLNAGDTNTLIKTNGYDTYFNTTKDGENYNIANGRPVPFADYNNTYLDIDVNSDIPKLVIDIAPSNIVVEVNVNNRPDPSKKDTAVVVYYSLTSEEQTEYNQLSVKDESSLTAEETERLVYLEELASQNLNNNRLTIRNIIDITVIPELASNDVIYESSDKSVFVVSGDSIVVTGEGVATLTVRSRLNSSIFMEVNIVSVGFDFNDISWSLYSSSKDAAFENTLDIVSNNGDYIISNIGYRGDITFGIKYEFGLLNISGVEEHGKSLTDFLNALNIAGRQTKDYNNGGNIQLHIDGLNHSMSCSVLGSVVIEETLYFKYVVDGVEYYKYFTTTSKTITYNFVEGLFGIDGSDEINIIAINSDTFSVVLESDADTFEIEMRAELNGVKSDVFSGFKVDSKVNFANTVGGHLTISLQSIKYDALSKLKTYIFKAYVDEADQPKVSDNLNYILTFWVRNVDRERFAHTVNINVKPQEIDSIHINHYTNILFTGNSSDNIGSSAGNYKYPSDIIMPGRQSLLQIDVFPSFGKFDYMTIESNMPGLVFNQVVEAYNFNETYNEEYSWYDSYNNNQTYITNGIRLKDKYSYINYDEIYGEMLGYNGSIYVALSAGDALSGKTVTLTVSCFIDGQDTAVYFQTIDLKVESKPAVVVDVEKNEFIFGETLKLNINVQHTDSGFSASLKPRGELTEYIDVLASVTYSVKDRSYVLNVKDGRAVYEMFHDYMYREFELSISASKLINGNEEVSTETIYLILVPFEVRAIDFNLAGITKTNHGIIAEYYQVYEIDIDVIVNYSNNYASWLKIYKNSQNMEKQIAALNNTIANEIANSSILKQGTATNRRTLLSSMQYEYSGEFSLQFKASLTPAETIIRFTSTEISEFLWAEIGINYTTYGIEVTNSEFATYSLSDYMSVVIDTASNDDRPEPITSVKDLMNMREGVSYILMKDLYLENWSPIEAKFATFDGNGFVLSIASFADVSEITADENGNFNIGIFSVIKEKQIVKNLTIEVNPTSAPVNYTEEDIEEGTYDDKVNAAIIANAPSDNGDNVYKTKLFVDISKLGGVSSSQQVSFGLLAGTNNGTITNINITNNATELRNLRDKALNDIYTSNYGLRINYGDNFALSVSAFKNVTATDTVRVSYLKENETTTLSRNNQIALLVGSNSGFITNSSAENISVEGEDYLAGLVSRNSGKISSSYFSGGNVISGNILGETGVKTGTGSAGFVAINTGDIYYSFVKGQRGENSIIPASAGINTKQYISDSGIPLIQAFNGSGVITGSYAAGFVFENTGKINNSYARILVAGNNSSGFAHKNEQAPEGDNPGSVIEFCYAIADIRKEDNGSYPFTSKSSKANANVKSGGTITDCFYLTTEDISTTLDDAGTGLTSKDFGDYMAFVGYAFNVDYQNNSELIDGAWFMPSGSSNLSEQYFNRNNLMSGAPELVNANQRTISLRYLISADDASAAYTYSYVQEVDVAGAVASGRGTVLNPILISSAENFNKQVISKGTSESRNFRFINDIQFSEDDEVATTYNATFSGKLDGNGMTIKNLRISADEVKDDGLTRLGLFAKIEGYPIDMTYNEETVFQDNSGYYYIDAGGNKQYVLSGDVTFDFFDEAKQITSYAVVKNLNVEIEQIDGMNVNMVGVLAGEVNNGKIYNITVSGEEDVVIQGLNAVGGIAGRIKGETDLVNITSNVSVKANYFYEYNAFTSFEGHKTSLLQDFYVYRNFSDTKLDTLITTSLDFSDRALQTYLSWKDEDATQYIGVKDDSGNEVKVNFAPIDTSVVPKESGEEDGAYKTRAYALIWKAFVDAKFVTKAKYPGTEITFADIIGENRKALINLPKIKAAALPSTVVEVTGEEDYYVNSIHKAVEDRRALLGYSGDNLTFVSYAGGIVGICENNRYPTMDELLIVSEEERGDADDTRANMYRSRRLYTEGNVSISGEVVGGIFGYLSDNSNMSDCELVAGTTMKLNASRIAGGLVGHSEGDIKRCYVENDNQKEIDDDIAKNYEKYDNSTSDISLGTQTLFQSNAMYIGGLVGVNYNAKIEYAYNKVNVVNKESLYAGGAVGLSIQSKYDQIYTTGSVYAYRGIGGFIGLVTTNIEAIDFYDNFANPDAKYIFAKLDDNASSTSITNVVIANIWSYSHLNTNRDTLANPNSVSASIGMIAGKYEDDTEYEAPRALGLQYQTLADRAITDNIYYKQTFTYNSVKNTGANSKYLIKEIGEGHQVNKFLNVDVGNDNFVSATEIYATENDSYLRYLMRDAAVIGNYYNNSDNIAFITNEKGEEISAVDTKDKLAYVEKYFMELKEVGEYTSGGLYDANTKYIIDSSKVKVNTGKLKPEFSSYYQYYENNGMSLVSGKFRDSFNTGADANAQKYYSYSRMASFGSFRSLEEIYSRKLIISTANELYKEMYGASGISENEDSISVWCSDILAENGDPTKDNSGTSVGTEASATTTANNIYTGWNSSSWYGIGLDSEGKRTEKEYVFPHLKNSKDVFSLMFVYDQKDLLKMKTNPNATFILMNDIVLNSDWTPVCGASNPFKGTLRSARYTKDKDADGANAVYEDQVFTIFNLDISVDSSYDSMYVGLIGHSDGATFENFNLHIKSIKSDIERVEYVGGLVGYAKDSTFNNITVFGGEGPISSTVNSNTWLSNAQTSISTTSGPVNVYKPEYCAVKKYGSTKGLVNQFAPLTGEKKNIVVNHASFVGAVAGQATNCVITEYYETYKIDAANYVVPDRFNRVMQKASSEASGIITYGNELVNTCWYPTMGVYNIEILNVGAGYSTIDVSDTMMTYYVGGAFGDISLSKVVDDSLVTYGDNPITTNPEDGTVRYFDYTERSNTWSNLIDKINAGVDFVDKFTIRDVNIESIYVANDSSTTLTYKDAENVSQSLTLKVAERNSSFAYDSLTIPTGMFISGFAGRLSNIATSNKNLFNGLTVLNSDSEVANTESINVDVSYGYVSTLPICENIKFGGLLGLTDINSMRDIVINGEIKVEISQPSSAGFMDKQQVSGSRSQHMVGGLIGAAESVDMQYITTTKDIEVILNDSNMTSSNDCELYVGGMIGMSSSQIKDIYVLDASKFIVYNDETSTSSDYPSVYFGGVIGTASTGSIQNLAAKIDVDITQHTKNGYYGGVLGHNSATANQIYVDGQVDVNIETVTESGIVYIGGFAGSNDSLVSEIVSNVNTYTETNAKGCNIGGIVGALEGNGKISNSYSTGNIVVKVGVNTTYEDAFIGGIVGVNLVTLKNIVNNCLMTGSVYFIGDNTTINKILSSNRRTGGIIGYGFTYSAVSNCVYNKDHMMMINDYGTGYTTEEMLYGTSGINMSGLTSVWNDSGTDTYNTLKWLNEDVVDSTNNNFLTSDLADSINGYITTRQNEGTKINPLTVSSSSNIGPINEGSYYYNGEQSDLRQNVAYIWDCSSSGWDETSSKTMHELVNAAFYYKGGDVNSSKSCIASIDKNSILDGFNLSAITSNKFVVYNNEGYIVNSKFSSSNGESLIISNSGLIINSEFTTGALDWLVAVVGHTNTTHGDSLGSSMLTYYKANSYSALENPGLTLYSTFNINSVLNTKTKQYFSKVNKSKLTYIECEFIIKHDTATNTDNLKGCIPVMTVDNCEFRQYNTSGELLKYYFIGDHHSDDTTHKWHGVTSYITINRLGNKVTEYDFSEAYYDGYFDFTKKWTWLSTTALPQLQMSLKAHWHDKNVKTVNSWDLLADKIHEKYDKQIKTVNFTFDAINNDSDLVRPDGGKDYNFKLNVNGSTYTFDDVDNGAELAYILKYYGYITTITNYKAIINITSDICLDGAVWVSYTFKGTFNGNEHYISDLIAISTHANAGGLFTILQNESNVNNLVLKNVTALRYKTAKWQYYGAVAGIAKASTLEKVGVEGYNVYTTDPSLIAEGDWFLNGILLGVYQDYESGGTYNRNKTTRIENCYGIFEVNAYNKGKTSLCAESVGTNTAASAGDDITISNYYSVAYDTTANNAIIAYLKGCYYDPDADGIESISEVHVITPSNLAEYQGSLAETKLPNFDFIIDWQAETDANVTNYINKASLTSAEKAQNNLKYNFGLPRFRTDLKFWWDIDKMSGYTAEEITANGYKDVNNDGRIDGYWVNSLNQVDHSNDWTSIRISSVEQLVWLMKVVNNSSDVVYSGYIVYYDNSGNRQYYTKTGSSIKVSASTIRSASIQLDGALNSKIYNLSGRVWTPIGTSSHSFKGEFNGGGCTISNMSCVGIYTGNKASITKTYSGLFGYVKSDSESAKIYNFKMTGTRVTSTQYAGAAVAFMKGTSGYNAIIQDVTIDNSSSRGYVSIMGNTNHSYIGGLAGRVGYAVIFNNEVKGSSSRLMLINTKVEREKETMLGGVVGYMNNSHIVSNVVSYLELINLTGNASFIVAVGGIVGYAYNTNVISNRVGNYSTIQAETTLKNKMSSDPNSISEYIKIIDDREKVYSGGAVGYISGGSSHLLSEIAVYYNMNMMKVDGMVVGYVSGLYANNLYVAYNDGDTNYSKDDTSKFTSDYKFIGGGTTDVRNSIIVNLTELSSRDSVENYNLRGYQYNKSSGYTRLTPEGGVVGAGYGTFFANIPTFLKQTSAYKMELINYYDADGNGVYNDDSDYKFWVINRDDEVYHYSPATVNSTEMYINFWKDITTKQALTLKTSTGNNAKFNWQSTGESIVSTLWSNTADTDTSDGNQGNLTGLFEIGTDSGNYTTVAKLRNLVHFRVGVNVGFNIKFADNLAISSPIGHELYPFGTSDSNYSFTVNGNSKTVNLNISLPDSSCVGLFAYTKNINFKNMTLQDNTSGGVTGKYYVGALVGKSINNMLDSDSKYVNATITNVSSSTTVTGNASVGGLVGYSENLTIKGSSNGSRATMTGTVTGKGVPSSAIGTTEISPFTFGSTVGVHLGGLVGMAKKNLKIQYMNMTGSIVVDDEIEITHSNAIGGMVGFYVDNDGGSSTNPCSMKISYCNVGTAESILDIESYATNGNSIYTSSYIGGVVGYAEESKSNMKSATATTDHILDSTISNVDVYAYLYGLDYIGGIAGKYQGYITRCNFKKGSIFSDGAYAGGIVGNSAWGDISSCTTGTSTDNVVTIDATKIAGGIVGQFSSNGSTRYSIKNCDNYAPITCFGWNTTLSDYAKKIGGIVGIVDDGQVKYSYNWASLSDSSWKGYISGVAGQAYSTIFDTCYSVSKVEAPNAEYVGGVIGYYKFDVDEVRLIKNVHAYNNVIGKKYVGGIVGYYNYSTSHNVNTTVMQTLKLLDLEIAGELYVGAIAGYITLGSNNVKIRIDNLDVENVYEFKALVVGESYVAGAATVYCGHESAQVVRKDFNLSGVHVAYISNGGNTSVGDSGSKNSMYVSGENEPAVAKKISLDGYKNSTRLSNSSIAFQISVYVSDGSIYTKIKHSQVNWTGEDSAKALTRQDYCTYESGVISVNDNCSFKIKVEITYDKIIFMENLNYHGNGFGNYSEFASVSF